MNREDVLRELELLPVWKLRAPVQILETAPIEKTGASVAPEVVQPEVVQPEVVQEVAKVTYEITISSDKNWCFICLVSRMDIDFQSMLFNNILHALHIEKTTKTQAENLQNIDAKMIIAMGEAVVQALLNSQESLENLRGKLRATNIVATYDLPHLLANPADKAKAWEDLCFAKVTMRNL